MEGGRERGRETETETEREAERERETKQEGVNLVPLEILPLNTAMSQNH